MLDHTLSNIDRNLPLTLHSWPDALDLAFLHCASGQRPQLDYGPLAAGFHGRPGDGSPCEPDLLAQIVDEATPHDPLVLAGTMVTMAC